MAGTSKYQDVKGEIEARITRGEWPVGTQLPGEPDLVELFHYSRGTVRQALDELANEGVISRRSGLGTYIMRKPQLAKTTRFMSMTAQIQAAGLVPSTKFRRPPMRMMAREAGRQVCEGFSLDPKKAAETPIYVIDRIRLGNDRPLAWQTVYLLASDFSDGVLESLKETQSLFDLYRQYHRTPFWADEIIEARPLLRPTVADESDTEGEVDEFELLQIEEISGKPSFVYVRERTTYDSANIPLEYLRSVERSDFFRRYHYKIWEENQA